MSLYIIEAAYERLIYSMLQPDPFRDRFYTGPTLGPITKAEHILHENRERGRLLYEQAKDLGFYAEYECDY